MYKAHSSFGTADFFKDLRNRYSRAEEAYRNKLVLQKRGLMDDLLSVGVRVSGGGEGNGA